MQCVHSFICESQPTFFSYFMVNLIVGYCMQNIGETDEHTWVRNKLEIELKAQKISKN